jgi:glycosyltransferase involved in cell wall biosynthesis
VQPQLSIVVASRDRPLRLRWLLNALAEQTLDRALWEVVVCHDSRGPETAELLAAHPLARSGTLRAHARPRSTAGAKRNAGVQLARAPVVVFTDDDCRPPPEWLENVLAAVRRNPGAIIQGVVEGDPQESAIRRSPYPRTQWIPAVPTPWAESCNIVYPRQVVRRIGGFAEDLESGEDTDLNLRARAAGHGYVGEPRMVTYHAIEEGGIRDWVRTSRRWQDIPLLVKRQPRLRDELYLRVFWKREHLWLLLALWAMTGVATRSPRTMLVAPWALRRGAHRGDLRGRVRDLAELPGWALIDLAELLVLVGGSIRHRTLVL